MALQQIPPKTTISVHEIHNNFRQLLHRVQAGEESVVFEEAGNEVAALISMPMYEEFQRWYVKKLMKQLGEDMSAEFEQRGITSEEQVADLMEEDRQAIYEKYYGKKA